VSADQDAVDGRRELAADGLAADPELGGLAADPTAAPTIYDVARAAGVSVLSSVLTTARCETLMLNPRL